MKAVRWLKLALADNPAYSYLRKLEFDFREAIVVGTLTKTDGVVDDVLTAGMPQGTPLLELSYLHMPTVLTLTTVEDAKLSEWQGETEETEAWRNGECGKSDMRVRALMRAGVVDIQMLTIVGDLLG